MAVTVTRRHVAALVVLLGLAGCAAPGSEPAAPASPEPTPSVRSSPAPPPAPSPSAAAPSPQPTRAAYRRLSGIDVSHHQGEVAWDRVAADGISFAYLKATEGSTFTDPAFADHWRRASAAGLRVGGYHYFSLCSEPLPQADHFVTTLAQVSATGRRSLPPVVDLELLGNCDPSPAPATMRSVVESFVREVEQRTGRRVVVYTHPDFDARYGFVDDLGRPRWVRRPGDVPPPGDWLLWQRADDGRVDGIDGPVDLDVLRTRVDSRR